MRALYQLIAPQWRWACIVILIAIFMTLGYDLGWKFGLPLSIRNFLGLILFACIMFGCGVAYIGSRLAGASIGTSAKIGLTPPVLWHVKEMIMAANIYGVGQGVYSGLQGPYLFYFCLMFIVMGICHLLTDVYQRFRKPEFNAQLLSTGYFFLPLLVIGGLEGVVNALFGFDIFVFQGFLAGYKTLFM